MCKFGPSSCAAYLPQKSDDEEEEAEASEEYAPSGGEEEEEESDDDSDDDSDDASLEEEVRMGARLLSWAQMTWCADTQHMSRVSTVAR